MIGEIVLSCLNDVMFLYFEIRFLPMCLLWFIVVMIFCVVRHMRGDGEDLPDWFVRDEKRNYFHQMPVTKAGVHRFVTSLYCCAYCRQSWL